MEDCPWTTDHVTTSLEKVADELFINMCTSQPSKGYFAFFFLLGYCLLIE